MSDIKQDEILEDSELEEGFDLMKDCEPTDVVPLPKYEISQLADWENWSVSQLKVMKELAAWVQAAQGMIPHAPRTIAINARKLKEDMRPTGYIDAQVVLQTGLQGDLEEFLEEDMRMAFVPLEYTNGWPQTWGLPFWEKLDGELSVYYKLFKIFLELRATHGTRAIYELANRTEIEKRNLEILSKAYHWALRAEAHDDYQRLKLYQLRDSEICDMEGRHKRSAKTLFKKLTMYLEDVDLDNMAPKDVIKLLQTVVALERVTLGLPKDKAEEVPRHVTESPVVQINSNNVVQAAVRDAKVNEVLEDNALAIADILRQVGALPGQEAQEVAYTEVDETKDLIKDLEDKLSDRRIEATEVAIKDVIEVADEVLTKNKDKVKKLSDELSEEAIKKLRSRVENNGKK